LPLRSKDTEEWLILRRALWPDTDVREHREEMAGFLAATKRFAQYIARNADSEAVGFIEASIRTDYVNGTETSPVAFIEGLFVARPYRRQGIARKLVRAVAQWAKARGCTELASDALLENRQSHAMHRRLGFVETERVVYFNRRLR
jgi:aminoglycoside 6'-N-acetyltransferase I